MVGIDMYAKIQRLKEKGYKKQQAAKELSIDRKTIRKYWDMGETEYVCYHLETKERTKIMDPYRDFVLDEIMNHPEINSSIIYDHLLETFKDFAPSKRTAHGFLCATCALRKASLLQHGYGNTVKHRSCHLDSKGKWI